MLRRKSRVPGLMRVWYQGERSPYSCEEDNIIIIIICYDNYHLEVIHILQVGGDIVIRRVDDRLVQVHQQHQLTKTMLNVESQ